MNSRFLIPLIFLLGCGTEDKDKSTVSIIGGEQIPNNPTQQSLYPSTIGILTKSGGCTGVRIADSTYLTAVHCFREEASSTEILGQVYASNTFGIFDVKLTDIRRYPAYNELGGDAEKRGTDIASFSIQFKAQDQKLSWDKFVTTTSLDYSLPMKGRDVLLAGYGCARKEATFGAGIETVDWHEVKCIEEPKFMYMKAAKSKIYEMNTHYFTLEGVKDKEGITGFISNGDSGSPVYSTSGQIMAITSSGNKYAWVVAGEFYNTYTYHSWVGYEGVKPWIDQALSSDATRVKFNPYYHGTVTLSDGSYVGELKDGLRNGKGSIAYNDFRTFTGEWSGDKRNGYGEQSWPPSSKYEEYKGQWVNDLPEGEGTLVWRDGTKYIGGFKGALYNGKGHIERPNGDVRDGTWVLDKMEGEVILTTKDGTKWKETYVDGKRVSAVKI